MSAVGESAGGVSPDGAGAEGPPGPDGQSGHGRADDSAPRVVPPHDVPAPGAPENQMLVCSLNVPLESPLVAEFVQHNVLQGTQNTGTGVNREVTTQGSVITVRWTEEDPLLLRTSTNPFLEQLDLVMHCIPAPMFPYEGALSMQRRGNT
ncbi:EKC/KEOPS complex subunit LAGE3-like [Echinops telfairi]|uniref:EKC/KEOPS complex subunit LAGE3-like n=1 Tax=Echinops telfairi TaxID=9371 RepID=A0AC55CNQ7_ECHTE|nr:EKC/KEOPS complex subunit LAGE3-like [Echinops telfairi]